MKQKIKCKLCGKKASSKFLYAQPGDIEGDFCDWIFLCDEHTKEYKKSGYPEPIKLKE